MTGTVCLAGRMARMEVRFAGSGDAFGTGGRFQTCIWLQAGQFTVLADCGATSLTALKAQRLDPGQVDAVLISHLHADHCLDMCSYQVLRTYHPEGPLAPIPVYAPAGAADRLDRAAGVDSGHPVSDAFSFVTLSPGKIEIGPFEITADHMNHPVETFGIRLEHDGRAIAYSADTGPTDRLTGLAAGADTLLCEASFTDAPDLPPDLHLTARQAAEHATRAGVGALVLTHLVPWNDRDVTRAEAEASFTGSLSLAVAGQIL